jgi:hypothetical protein
MSKKKILVSRKIDVSVSSLSPTVLASTISRKAYPWQATSPHGQDLIKQHYSDLFRKKLKTKKDKEFKTKKKDSIQKSL